MKLKSVLISVLLMSLILFHSLSETKFFAISDQAAILSDQTITEAERLSRLVEEKTSLRIAVHIRHFLGGADSYSYAQRLLNESEHSEDTLLLLMVVGEDAYARAIGSEAKKIISLELCDTLLSTNFRKEFKARNYDIAVADFMLSCAKEAGKQSGIHIDLDGFFGYNSKQNSLGADKVSPQKTKSIQIFGSNTLPNEPSATPSGYTSNRNSEQRGDRSLSISSIVVIGLVLSSIFGKNEKGRSRGCGCGPLGWIFGVFGLSKLFGWRK